MRVRIVCYEDVDKWILGKFALKLTEELDRLSVKVEIEKTPDKGADINHHIIFCDYDGRKSSIDTVMITHVDTFYKTNLLKRQLKSAELGICMSSSTMNQLACLGVPRKKLCYVSPAHDGLIKPRPIKIGITSKLHNDGRKREALLDRLIQIISPDDFCFSIMGEGWYSKVQHMQKKGFLVDYYHSFNYQAYVKLIPTFDYFLYLGNDEGSMGFIDALTAGVPTIVTPQGFHLDAIGGIVHPFDTLEELSNIFVGLANKKKQLISAVEHWTWKNYAIKHLQLWEFLLSKSDKSSYLKDHVSAIYQDGIFSLIDAYEQNCSKSDKINYYKDVIFGSFKNLYFSKINRHDQYK